MSARISVLLMLSTALALPSTECRADIAFSSWQLTTLAENNATDSITRFAQPADGNFDTATNEVATARTDYEFVISNSYALLDFGFTHERGLKAQSIGYVDFSVDADTPYSIEGDFTLTGNQRCYLAATIFDKTANAWVFNNGQDSRTTLNEILAIGEEGGDYDNSLIGPPSGILQAGHLYEFNYHAFIDYNGVHSTTASASGDVSLELGKDANVVPAPSALALGAVGLGLVGWVGRHRGGRRRP